MGKNIQSAEFDLQKLI